MTARRRLLAALSAGAAVFALTGCEAPAPIVTVYSGMGSEWKEADVFCFEGQALDRDECVQRGEGGSTQIEVVPGERVGVDVSKDVAERGWYLELSGPDGQPQSSAVQEDEHYFSFTAPNVDENGLRLTVKTLGEQGPQGPHSGEWVFDLVPKD